MASMTFLVSYLAATAAKPVELPHTFINYRSATIDSIRFDGVGGLSGGGATSTFLFAYEPSARAKILDWMFKPDFAGSLDILKVSSSHARVQEMLYQLIKYVCDVPIHPIRIDTHPPYKNTR